MSLKSLQLREPGNEKTYRRKDKRGKDQKSSGSERSQGQPGFADMHSLRVRASVGTTPACNLEGDALDKPPVHVLSNLQQAIQP